MINSVAIKDFANIIVPTRDKPKHFRGNVPWVTLPDIQEDLLIGKAKNCLTHEDAAEVGNRLMPPKTVLLSCAGSLGKVAVTTKEIYANQQFYGLVVKENIADPFYLAYSLKYLSEDFFKNLAGVSTIGFFSKEKALGIRIPLPPLEEQMRIAAIARKCDRFRRTRRFTQQLSDTYLPSVFLEMFGDPVTNPKNWDVEALGNSLSRIESGINFTPISEDEPASAWRVLKVSAVSLGVFDPFASKPISPNTTFNDSLIIQKGDLLMSRANTKELVGAVSIVRENPPKVLLPDKLWKLKFSPASSLNSDYVLHVLRHPRLREVISDMASGTSGSMQNITKEETLALPIPVPPLPIQEKFSLVAQRFERLRTQQREADRQAEHLFQTVLHRAFQGEL